MSGMSPRPRVAPKRARAPGPTDRAVPTPALRASRVVKRDRGHWCWSCQQTKPNEAFSGGNHGRHLCRVCASERRRAARDQRKHAAAAATAPAEPRPSEPTPGLRHRQPPGRPGLDDEWTSSDLQDADDTGVPSASVMDLLETALALSVDDRSFLAEQLVETLPADPRWFAELECRVRRAITDPMTDEDRTA